MARKLPIYRFGKQLQTRRAEDFGSPDEFRIFQNARVRDGLLGRRPGKARVAVAGTDGAALNFDGAADYLTIPLDTRVWTLGLRWSIRMIVKSDLQPVADQYLLGIAGAGNKGVTLHVNSSKFLVANVWDSAGNQTTLTSTTDLAAGTAYPIMLTRDAGTLKLYVGRAVDDTDTMSSTLSCRTPSANIQIGCHNTANFFDGDIDHLTVYNTCLPNNLDGFLRPDDPMADDVTACYLMEKDANEYVEDLSRYGNTALATSAPISATGLSVQDAVVQGMAPFTDKAGKKRLLVVAGGRVYAPEMA